MTPDVEAHLSQLVATLAEDVIFVLAGDDGAVVSSPFEALARRRADLYADVLAGKPRAAMLSSFDAWMVDLSRAIAPIAPPDWLPMGDVLRLHITLEAGARGLRSLFSDKPSDKDVAKVKRLGTLAARLLRQVQAAEGATNSDDARVIAAFVASLGLPQADASALLEEPVMHLDVYGDVEPKVLRAIVSGAWLAAAADGVHPREEEVIRAFATKAGITLEQVEESRAAALAKVEAKRQVGLAAIDYVRAVLRDRLPGIGETLPRRLGLLLLPRRYRDEGLAPLGYQSPVVLAKRYTKLSRDERTRVLGITWAAALLDDPSVSRQAVLRVRYEHMAADLDSDGKDARELVSQWVSDVLAETAKALGAPDKEPRRE
jgi:hypothetical protein